MHARVTILQTHADRFEEAQKFWEQEVLPALRLQPGFCRLLVVGDRATGKGYAVTLWTTEADERNSMHSDYMRELVAKAEPFLAEPPIWESHEVICSSTRQ